MRALDRYEMTYKGPGKIFIALVVAFTVYLIGFTYSDFIHPAESCRKPEPTVSTSLNP